MGQHKHHPVPHHPTPPKKKSRAGIIFASVIAVLVVIAWLMLYHRPSESPEYRTAASSESIQNKFHPTEKWLQRAYAVDEHFHIVYTSCWEGAYGAIGDAYLFASTHDSSLLRFHTVEHDMRAMCEGTWVDDRAWVALAEFTWWDFTGRTNSALVEDAKRRYLEARNEGRLSNHEGVWSWYNYPPAASSKQHVFTNSNMNQMASVACWLYEATGDRQFLNDALLVWNGDKSTPGIEKTLYKGDGRWVGKPGLAAFGKQLPWGGVEYSTLGGLLYRITKELKYKNIIVATVKRILNPANGWVDPQGFFQIHMDGNGAFVNYLFDAYAIAPDELKEVPAKVDKMLEHVWTNNNGTATVTLHRESDDGIRNGWNTTGGEDGYGVNEVGTVHAQAEAVRAFGIFAYYENKHGN